MEDYLVLSNKKVFNLKNFLIFHFRIMEAIEANEDPLNEDSPFEEIETEDTEVIMEGYKFI